MLQFSYFVALRYLAVSPSPLLTQAARQGLEKCQQELVSAGSDAGKASAQIGVELYEAVLKALEH